MVETAKRREREVLVFEVAGQRYGVAGEHVREVLRAALPAPLPDAPSLVTGVLNVRGEIVPLLDLSVQLGRPRSELRASDFFVLVRSERRTLAFLCEQTPVLRRIPGELAQLGRETREQPLGGALALADGVLLLWDVERFLSERDAALLERALRSHEGTRA